MTTFNLSGVITYIQSTSEVYGPNTGGLRFGTSYVWISKDGINWVKTDYRSITQAMRELQEIDNKKMSDFSKCRDPEFAKIQWKLSQLMITQAKNNPFLKYLEKIKRGTK